MSENGIVKAHDSIRHLIDITHYDDHPDRVETAEFAANKKKLHAKIAAGELNPCFINNGYCHGGTEIHHRFVEYSAGDEVDYNLVHKDSLINNPDDEDNLEPICKRHHVGSATGTHSMSRSSWILQKYLKPASLALFEAAVAHLKERVYPDHEDKTHPDHRAIGNHAENIIKTLAAKQKKEID